MVVIRGYCHSSLKSKATSTVYVILITSGDALAAQCKCIAGKGEACSHFAALLFYIKDMKRTEVKHLHSAKAVTDHQQWHVPAKRSVVPTLQPVSMEFHKAEESSHKGPCCKTSTLTKPCIGRSKSESCLHWECID